MSERDLELHMNMTANLLRRLLAEGVGIDEIVLRLIAL